MATYFKIAEANAAAGGSASLGFTVIPATYTDLLIKLSLRGSTSSNNIDTYLTINSSTANFTGRYIQGNSSAAGSYTLACYSRNMPESTATVSPFRNTEIYFPNYAGSTYKSFSIDTVDENNTGTAGLALVQFIAGLWSDTSAITSISIAPSSGTFVQYSTATLYGISKS